MVAPRMEPGRGTGTPEEKQPRDPKPEAAPAPVGTRTGSWQNWLPLGAAIVVMPLLAYATTSFVLVPQMQKALRSSGAAPAAAHASHAAESGESGKDAVPPPGTKQSVTLNKLLVNVAGTMGSRYLLTSITLLGDTEDFPGRVTQHEPQLRDMASGILNTKTIADLEKPGARNLIRGELISGFNTILGKAAVQEIYFTEFAIQ